jgi:hypothetical protein
MNRMKSSRMENPLSMRNSMKILTCPRICLKKKRKEERFPRPLMGVLLEPYCLQSLSGTLALNWKGSTLPDKLLPAVLMLLPKVSQICSF